MLVFGYLLLGQGMEARIRPHPYHSEKEPKVDPSGCPPSSNCGSFNNNNQGSNFGSFNNNHPGSNFHSFNGNHPGSNFHSFNKNHPGSNFDSFKGNNPGSNFGSFKDNSPGSNVDSFKHNNPGSNFDSFKGSSPGMNVDSFKHNNPGANYDSFKHNKPGTNFLEPFEHNGPGSNSHPTDGRPYEVAPPKFGVFLEADDDAQSDDYYSGNSDYYTGGYAQAPGPSDTKDTKAEQDEWAALFGYAEDDAQDDDQSWASMFSSDYGKPAIRSDHKDAEKDDGWGEFESVMSQLTPGDKKGKKASASNWEALGDFITDVKHW